MNTKYIEGKLTVPTDTGDNLPPESIWFTLDSNPRNELTLKPCRARWSVKRWIKRLLGIGAVVVLTAVPTFGQSTNTRALINELFPPEKPTPPPELVETNTVRTLTNKFQAAPPKSAVVTDGKPFPFVLLSNQNGECMAQLIDGTRRVFKVTIHNAPKTLWRDPVDFSQQKAYIDAQAVRLTAWRQQLESSKRVNNRVWVSGNNDLGVIQAERNVAAQETQLAAQETALDNAKQQLAEAETKAEHRPPTHHPVKCVGCFVSPSEWRIVN